MRDRLTNFLESDADRLLAVALDAGAALVADLGDDTRRLDDALFHLLEGERLAKQDPVAEVVRQGPDQDEENSEVTGGVATDALLDREFQEPGKAECNDPRIHECLDGAGAPGQKSRQAGPGLDLLKEQFDFPAQPVRIGDVLHGQFQLGARLVVGTAWRVHDRDALAISSAVYQAVSRGNPWEEAVVAAMCGLRDELGDDAVERWSPFLTMVG